MGMGLGLTLTPRIRLANHCSVCKQEINSHKAEFALVDSTLFGHVAFAICPCCGQVAPNMRAKAYLARAAAWVQETTLRRLRENHGRCKAGEDGDCTYAQCPQDDVYLSSCPLLVDEGDEAG